MQPRYLFIPHKDIIMEIIAYIMQLIAELEKSFSFFFFLRLLASKHLQMPTSSSSSSSPSSFPMVA